MKYTFSQIWARDAASSKLCTSLLRRNLAKTIQLATPHKYPVRRVAGLLSRLQRPSATVVTIPQDISMWYFQSPGGSRRLHSSQVLV